MKNIIIFVIITSTLFGRLLAQSHFFNDFENNDNLSINTNVSATTFIEPKHSDKINTSEKTSNNFHFHPNTIIAKNCFSDCKDLLTTKALNQKASFSNKSLINNNIQRSFNAPEQTMIYKQKNNGFTSLSGRDMAFGLKAAYNYSDKESFEIGVFYAFLPYEYSESHCLGINASGEIFEDDLKCFPKLTFSYSYLPENPIVLFNLKFSYSRYENNLLTSSAFTPEIGFSIVGIVHVTYGYHIFTNNAIDLSNDQLSIAVYIPLATDFTF